MKVNTLSDDVYDLAGDIAQLLEAPDKAGQIYQGLLDCMRHAKNAQGRSDSLLTTGDALYETLDSIEDDLADVLESGNPDVHKVVMSTIVDKFGQNVAESEKAKLEADCAKLDVSVWKTGHVEIKHQPLVGALLSIFVHAVQKQDSSVQDYISKLYDVADMLENYTEVVV